VELPGILSPAQLSGTEPLPEPLPLAGELERVFAARVSQLEPGLRTLALLCACSGRLPAITAAAEALDVDAAGLDRLDGLVSIEAPAVAALLADLRDSGDPRDALIAGLYRSVGAVPSPRTVDHHLRGIYRKFGITSRAELALLADELAEA
jgi:hypothetical protein